MRLTRVRIEALRHFHNPLEIRDLADGINLFVGPNGAGKSTIVRAIRAAFFERYVSGSASDLLPWGDPGAAPSVEVDFASGGRQYRLRKRFLSRQRCSLDIDGKAFENTEAEGHLGELLGFQYAGKGASKPQHWGVPGLLWIQQGCGQELDAVGHATDHLRKALDQSLGEVASTGGDEMFERVQAEREKLLTKTGQATGKLREATRMRAEAGQRVEALASQLLAYRQQVDRFGLLNAQILASSHEQPWKCFETEAKAAQDQLDRIARVREALAADRQILSQAHAQLRLLEQHQASFAQQAATLEQRRRAAGTTRALLGDAELALSPRAQQLAAAQVAHGEAQSALAAAELQERRRHQLERVEVLQQRHAALEATLAQGREIVTRLNQHRQEIARSRISDEQLEALRRYEREAQAARIRHEAVATTLSYRFEPGVVVACEAVSREGTGPEGAGLGSTGLEGTGSLQLVTRTVLTIAQVGTLTIEPGGGQDFSKLTAARAGVEAAQAALLRTLDLDSVAAAEQRLQQRNAAEHAAQVEQARLDQLAPRGLDAICAELAGVAGERDDVRARLSALVPDSQCAVVPVVAGVDARNAYDDARSAYADAAMRLRVAQSAENDVRAAWAAAKSGAAHADAELSTLQAALEADDHRMRVEQTLAELEANRQRLALLAVKVAQAEQRIDSARPQVLQQDVERLGRSARQALQAHEDRRDEVISLQAHLEAAGATGLEEQLADAQGTLERLQRRHRELERRARALDLLATMLHARRQALTMRLQAPLLKRLNHYLHLLMPGAIVKVDESLRPVALSMPAGGGGFPDLSFGTREQVSLISRLAYADLLKDADRPTLIILDDCLVNTDVLRLAQMKRILFDAAARHQILLFSCHPERWDDLGATARDVASLMSAPALGGAVACAPTDCAPIANGD